MVLIPAGDFFMGSDPQHNKCARDDEHPQHRLYLPVYNLGKTPVANAQYKEFVQATGHQAPDGWTNRGPPRGEEAHPAVNVSWYNARDYCQWLSEMTGRSYSLPSEAEWEKGVRDTSMANITLSALVICEKQPGDYRRTQHTQTKHVQFRHRR